MSIDRAKDVRPVPKTHTIAFTMPDARGLILSGKKTQTLRMAKSRGDVRVGDTLVLKEWIGVPRRKGSRCIEIVRVKCSAIAQVVIDLKGYPDKVACPNCGTACIDRGSLNKLARLDGFEAWRVLEQFLQNLYGSRKLDMVAIRWAAPKEEHDG